VVVGGDGDGGGDRSERGGAAIEKRLQAVVAAT